MSTILAPSKSTVYVSNLPYSLTNNDLHQIFEEYGKVVKVTILKDKVSRKSRGVAFVFFLKSEDALRCASAVNGIELFGRTLKASIACDNGRSSEFIRRRDYPDKTTCYECGDDGHLSYNCPKNSLGEREPPPKKQRIRKKNVDKDLSDADEESDDMETLGAAIAHQQTLIDAESTSSSTNVDSKGSRRRIRRDSYFSDEEESE